MKTKKILARIWLDFGLNAGEGQKKIPKNKSNLSLYSLHYTHFSIIHIKERNE